MSIFKRIKGNNYWVCDDGETVLNVNYRGLGKTEPVKHHKTKNGYKRLTLNGKHYLMSNLVAEAYLQKIEGKPQVDHRNGIRDDDRVENLRYCTAKENSNFEPHLTSMKNRRYKFKEESKEHMSLAAHNRFHNGKVCAFNGNGKIIGIYDTVKKASSGTGVCTKTVRNHLNGETINSRKDIYFKIVEEY